MSEARTLAHYQAQAIEGLQLQVERLQAQLDEITGDRAKSLLTVSVNGIPFPVWYDSTGIYAWVNGNWALINGLFTQPIVENFGAEVNQHEHDCMLDEQHNYVVGRV